MATIRIKRIPSKVKSPRPLAQLMRRTIRDEQRKEADRVKKDFLSTVSTWKKKPEFEIRDTRFGFDVFTDNDIFGYVDKGTRPHVIEPKKATVLAFSTGGSPKTRPGKFRAVSGKAGTNPVFAKRVQHPGTKPRKLTKKVRERSKKRYARNIQKAIAKVV